MTRFWLLSSVGGYKCCRDPRGVHAKRACSLSSSSQRLQPWVPFVYSPGSLSLIAAAVCQPAWLLWRRRRLFVKLPSTPPQTRPICAPAGRVGRDFAHCLQARRGGRTYVVLSSDAALFVTLRPGSVCTCHLHERVGLDSISKRSGNWSAPRLYLAPLYIGRRMYM